MSNTHSIPSVASFDANPRHTLPDEILNPLSDELEAIENLAGRLRKHAAADAFADHPHTLGQLDLLACSIGIVRIAEGLGRYMESLRTVPRSTEKPACLRHRRSGRHRQADQARRTKAIQ